jgi:hypothetical protein
MTANPRIGIGGRPPPSMDVNAAYLLWAVTTVSALLAALSLVANLWIYIFNGVGGVYGWPIMYPEMNHARWLFATGLFGVLGCAGFLLKMRVDARTRSITTVRLPDRLVARATAADPVLDKFQCRARVEIDVYSDTLARAIAGNPAGVSDILEKGLEIAISDQVTRYSKARIEETLKLSLGKEFDLLDIAGVTLLDLRQERVVDPPAERSSTNGTEGVAEDGASDDTTTASTAAAPEPDSLEVRQILATADEAPEKITETQPPPKQ